MKKIVLLSLPLAVALYLIAYLGLRMELVFVHRAGWATSDVDHRAKIAGHQVDSGDPGTPSFSRAAAIWTSALRLGFAPLMWAEEGYWMWKHPVGADWPYP